MRARAITLDSRDRRVDVTSSLARHTWLMDDRERFDARRCDTSVSSVVDAVSKGFWSMLSFEDDILRGRRRRRSMLYKCVRTEYLVK